MCSYPVLRRLYGGKGGAVRRDGTGTQEPEREGDTEMAYRARLMAAVRRSARKGAVMVLRSFAEPSTDESTEWAAKDRSILWGIVRVEDVALPGSPGRVGVGA